MIRIAASACRDLDEGFDFYEAQEITIFAVLDCRRDPAWIRGHLAKAVRTKKRIGLMRASAVRYTLYPGVGHSLPNLVAHPRV